MGTHPIFESDFDCLTEKMKSIWSVIGLLSAVSASSSSSSTQENKLIRVVVNNTESEPSPCLRSEFTAEFESNGQKIKLSDNVIDIGSNCGLLNIKDNATDIELSIEFQNNTDTWSMIQASVSYNTTEYSNTTIENVSAPLSGKYGQSFLCTAGFSIDLSDDSKLTLGRIQLQPFKVPEDTFANPVICPQDISVVIPAIVGTILALLVILVLITYVIGRRRTRIAYQEI